MQLIDFIGRSKPPVPWEEGDNIPWNEPGFSARMLKEHLSQEHDAASRRFPIIDRHVEWIHDSILSRQPAAILDLACGPGLYAERLARLGHTVHGIDFSPASIEYATHTATRDKLSCTYQCQDIRQASYPYPVKLVMLIYGEFNIFRPAHARIILQKAWEALKPGGILLLEPHPYRVVRQIGKGAPSWYSSTGGLFSPSAHVLLKENFWDTKARVATIRYFILDSCSGSITRFAQSFQAYQDSKYRSLLSENGFQDIQILPGLSGEGSQKDFIAIVARKASNP